MEVEAVSAFDSCNEDAGRLESSYTAMASKGKLLFSLLDASEEDVRDEIRRGFDVNGRDEFGQTPLMEAVANLQAARALLRHGADVNAASETGYTPLLKAVESGGSDPAVVQLLLDAGADPAATTRNGKCAFHLLGGCWRRGRVGAIQKIVRILKAAGLDINTEDAKRNTPLIDLVLLDLNEIIPQPWVIDTYWEDRTPEAVAGLYELLLGHKKNREDSSSKYWRTAIILLEAGANPDARVHESPSTLLAEGGTALMARGSHEFGLHAALIKAGADVNAKCQWGHTPLDYAVLARRERCQQTDDLDAIDDFVGRLERRGARSGGGCASDLHWNQFRW